MDPARFATISAHTLERIDTVLGDLEHEDLDVDLAGDVLTLGFADGVEFILNAHSAAGQIWLAAHRNAWHFDYLADSGRWVAPKTGEELLEIVAREVSQKLGISFEFER